MSDAHIVVIAGVCLACLSFAVYLTEMIAVILIKPFTAARAVAHHAKAQAGLVKAEFAKPTLPEFTALLEGMGKLVDSLSKAGPALQSIVAAVLFLLIAAIGAGAFQGAPKEPTTHSDTQPLAKTQAPNVQAGNAGAGNGGTIVAPDQKPQGQ